MVFCLCSLRCTTPKKLLAALSLAGLKTSNSVLDFCCLFSSSLNTVLRSCLDYDKIRPPYIPCFFIYSFDCQTSTCGLSLSKRQCTLTGKNLNLITRKKKTRCLVSDWFTLGVSLKKVESKLMNQKIGQFL